jgi:hypothetical protein
MKMAVFRSWRGGAFVLAAALLVGGDIPANAQVGSTAQINGTVKDSSGGVLQTGIVLQVSSNPVIPVRLALGELSETVAVEGAARLANPATLTGAGDPRIMQFAVKYTF